MIEVIELENIDETSKNNKRVRNVISKKNKKNNNVDFDVEKNKKKKSSATFNLIEVIIIMIITAVFGVLLGSFFTYFKENVVENEIPYAFEEFLDVYNELKDDYYSDVDSNDLINAGIKGMVDYLGDPYSSYLDYNSSSSLNDELTGEFVGMGATITLNDSNNVVIFDLIDNGPADLSGFKVGDLILKVASVDVEGKSVIEVSDMIKGEEGTKVDILVLRDNKELLLTLTRGKVQRYSVSYDVIDGFIGYVKIDVFAKNTYEQFKSAMDDIKSKNVKSVIVDVRNNYGGYLLSAESVASLFLNKDDTVYQLDTKGQIEKVKNDKDRIYNFDIVVLINGNSASASEILASSLKENVDAILIGEKTYGKGTVQKTKLLTGGTMIKYTVQEWFTPNGNKVDGIGISPDYEELLNEGYYLEPIRENDNQLKKAIEIIKNDKKQWKNIFIKDNLYFYGVKPYKNINFFLKKKLDFKGKNVIYSFVCGCLDVWGCWYAGISWGRKSGFYTEQVYTMI